MQSDDGWLGQIHRPRCRRALDQPDNVRHLGPFTRCPSGRQLGIVIINDKGRSRFWGFQRFKMVTGVFKTHRLDFALR